MICGHAWLLNKGTRREPVFDGLLMGRSDFCQALVLNQGCDMCSL